MNNGNGNMIQLKVILLLLSVVLICISCPIRSLSFTLTAIECPRYGARTGQKEEVFSSQEGSEKVLRPKEGGEYNVF